MLPLVLGVGWLSMEIGPKARVEIARIGMEARRHADLATIEPGKFTFGDQGAVVYAERVPGPGTVEKVFLQRRHDSGQVDVVIAERGEQRDSDDPNTRYFVLYNGRRYEGIPGSAEFHVMEFAEHGIPYQLPGTDETDSRPRERSVARLLASPSLENSAELHFRLAVPIATLILAILAVPLSRSQPRAGRYGKLAIGLLVFIIYFNLLSAGKTWIETATVEPAIGLWWVHGLMVAFAAILIGGQNGIHRRIFRVRLL
jgi:lipopolysaccharide export system permease protein